MYYVVEKENNELIAFPMRTNVSEEDVMRAPTFLKLLDLIEAAFKASEEYEYTDRFHIDCEHDFGFTKEDGEELGKRKGSIEFNYPLGDVEGDLGPSFEDYYGISGECSSCRGGGCIHCEPHLYI